MQHLDHLSLLLFILVYEEGTIARASERAFMAPSAVSKRISDIEVRFGTPLLSRSKRGVEPIPAGMALLRHGSWQTSRRSWSSCRRNCLTSC